MEFLNMANSVPGGTLRLANDLVVSRMGFGAMQLAGPGVFGPPRDRDQALAVLRDGGYRRDVSSQDVEAVRPAARTRFLDWMTSS